MHSRTEALARTAILALPSFDSAWFGRTAPDRHVMIVIGLAVIAIAALLVAGAAFLRDQRQRARLSNDEQLFTATPLPMGRDQLARLSRESTSHHAFTGLRIPRWVQAGSLVVALVVTWSVAQQVAPNAGMSAAKRGMRASASTSDPSEASPESLDRTRDSGPTFAFQARDWVTRRGGGCEGQLVVTKGEPNAWALTARVHDDEGQLIDTAHTRVSALRVGDVVEFNFLRADCDRIGAWDVRGDRQPR